MKKRIKTVGWFSAGVSSAVAVKLEIDNIDEIIYTHIEDQHPDSIRFISECQQWFGKPVRVVMSLYVSVENACLSSGGRGYINGPHGAACTKFLKRRVRREWEIDQSYHLRYVWGLDSTEQSRADRIVVGMPDQDHVFPLISQGIEKTKAHQILKASGISRPAMYDLGYLNNNCVGCVKGGMGYWNKIRVDFPEVFEKRALMERRIQATCIKGIYLDELDPDRGREQKPIVEDCGIFCEMMSL